MYQAMKTCRIWKWKYHYLEKINTKIILKLQTRIYKMNVKMTNLDVQALRVHVYPFYNERQIWILYMYANYL